MPAARRLSVLAASLQLSQLEICDRQLLQQASTFAPEVATTPIFCSLCATQTTTTKILHRFLRYRSSHRARAASSNHGAPHHDAFHLGGPRSREAETPTVGPDRRRDDRLITNRRRRTVSRIAKSRQPHITQPDRRLVEESEVPRRFSPQSRAAPSRCLRLRPSSSP